MPRASEFRKPLRCRNTAGSDRDAGDRSWLRAEEPDSGDAERLDYLGHGRILRSGMSKLHIEEECQLQKKKQQKWHGLDWI